MTSPQTTPMPGDELKAEKMPGHWLLARLGKRVLRPGGRQMTNRIEAEGFSVLAKAQAPMHLLEPWRIIEDEGMFGAFRFAINLLCNREARHRVLAMRQVFRRYRHNLGAVMLLGDKKEDPQ